MSSAPHERSPYFGYLEVRRLGRVPFNEAYGLQRDLLEARIEDRVGDVLILTEHDEVITHGRGSVPTPEISETVQQIEIERGGEATFHGPGQVVAYPIFKLGPDRRDLHRFLRDLEQVVIGVLAEFDLEGRREPGLTGVWIGDRKVCSIGIAVRRWVTWHGLALNVSGGPPNIEGFRPCGLDPEVMTRLSEHMQPTPSPILVEVLLVKYFCDVFGIDLPPAGHSTPGGKFPELPILPS